MFSGPGAGMLPTASAVLGDVINIAGNLQAPNPLITCHHDSGGAIDTIDDVVTQFYIRLIAHDKPGVIGTIGNSCGKFGISILSMVQKGEHNGLAEIVLVTHRVKEANMRQALADLKDHPTIQSIASVVRVEGMQ
jgi:homoserine dehydrogenase